MSNTLKAIAFDLFGTVFDMSATPREEIKDYLRQCVDPVWKPLELPDSWRQIPAFADAKEGLARLGSKFQVVTCSNAPGPLTIGLFTGCELHWDRITRLDQIKRYKPHPGCYLHACNTAGVEPREAMMVTANPTFGPYPFGDIQIAGAIGMQTRLIRNPGGPADIIALAEELGC